MYDDEHTGNPVTGMERGVSRAEGSESMTNLQILSEIEKLFEANEGNLDTAKLDAYLDILQERAPVAEDYDPNQAWEVFKRNNASLFEDDAAEEAPVQAKTPAQRKPRFRRLVGSIAAAAALICMVTVVSSASFRTWIREAYGSSFVYRFFNSEEAPSVLPDYEITDLPEGYELIADKSNDISGAKLYGLGESQIGFMYSYANDGSNTMIIPHNKNIQIDTSISINGQSADIYLSPDGSEANLLVWIDENEDLVFSISCFLDRDIMVQMAESVSKK